MELSSFKKWLESSPLFLVMVPFNVLLHLEIIYHHLANYRFALFQIVLLLLACLFFTFFSHMIEKDKRKSWLIAFVLMLFWCYLAVIKNFLDHHYPGYFFKTYTFFLPFSAAVLFGIIYLVKTSTIKLSRIFVFINVLWILFILTDFISLLKTDLHQNALKKRYALNLPDTAVADSLKPDIYYIIFDSYTSNSILDKMGSDNTAIEQKLKNKGFKIIDSSRSNYNLTPYSISSTLNMKYLDEVNTQIQYSLDKFLPGVILVKYNGLVPWLQKHGYNIINFSLFDFQGIPPGIKTFDVWKIEEAYRQYNAGLKILKELLLQFKRLTLFENEKIFKTIEHRDDTLYNRMKSTPGIKNNQPQFLYAHFFMPHYPNSRDSLGNISPFNPNLTGEQLKAGYIEEIKFVNKRIDSITDAILRHRQRPLVIIIQGDHGYRFLDIQKCNDEFPNFCAIFFSNGNYNQVPDTLSNVNVFKAVLNTFFHQKISFDKNQHFFLQYFDLNK